jgi:plasmid stability protein
MGQVLIRGLDDALIADYREAAAGAGRSLEAELRDALARARPKRALAGAEFAALVQELWAMTSESAAGVDSTPGVRADRDRR